MEERIAKIEEELAQMRERNTRVEGDKAWETSVVRVATISLVTYVLASLALLSIGDGNPFRNALIPALGFFLSTQSLPYIQRRWIARRKK